MSTLSEDDLIASIFAPIAGPGGLELKDDAALLSPEPGCDLVVTTDAIVAGVHFFADDPPASIARKAIGVNLSDLAAKGARPAGFLLTLALPGDWTEEWLRDFASGLGAAADEAGCPLLGGDTVKTPGPLTVSITALGQVPSGRMVRRTGAKAGDRLYVSGTIGDAALGLLLRLNEQAAGPASPTSADGERFLRDRYLHPRPRSALATLLCAYASGAMDISDGFVGDVRKMLRASEVGGSIDLAAVPLSPEARALIGADAQMFDRALTGGDDYEILASVPADAAAAFEKATAAVGVPVTWVGDVRAGRDVDFRDAAGAQRVFTVGSYQHF